jgi:MFS family permease
MHGIFSTSCLIGEDVREASIMGFRERIKDFLGINTSIISMLIMVILIGLGERMAERFLPLYLVAVGGTVFVVGFMNAMQNFLGAIYSFPGGYLSDKLGYKRSLMLFTVIALFGYAIVIIFPYWQAVIIGCIFFPVHNTGLYTFCCPFYGVYFSVPQTFQRFPNLLTIPNSPRKGCASFNERVPKTKKHRLQTVLYLNAKLTQTSIILGFYIVSIFAYLFGYPTIK